MDFEIVHENYIGEEKIVYLKKKPSFEWFLRWRFKFNQSHTLVCSLINLNLRLELIQNMTFKG
jgi:hypothetical protein